MPLPAALLQRLANRGIVVEPNVEASTSRQAASSLESEEIIAEDYDDVVEEPSQYDIEPVKKPPENFWIERMKRRIGETNSSGYKGCPNKSSIYHRCSLYCINRWGDGVLDPKRTYLRRRNRILKRYPLPKNWLEIYDYGSGLYYYWNTNDDTVSWLPPGHPRAKISKSAACLRRELEETLPPEMEEDDGAEQMTLDIHRILEEPVMPQIPLSRRPPSPDSPPSSYFSLPKKPKARDLDKAIRQKHSRKSSLARRGSCNNSGGRGNITTLDNTPLDPMDPAAYSDIPRGKWSEGLIDTDRAKSGVDPTATGALFQRRPYPSPGAILKDNAERANSTSGSSSSDAERKSNEIFERRGGGEK